MKSKRDDLHDLFLRDWALKECQRKYESGQRKALMEAIWWCIREGWPAPPWLRDAFNEAFCTAQKSWDEVFDPPIPKGAHRHRRDRNWKIGFRLAERIEFLHEKERRSITQGLFEEVGKEFGVSGSVARDLYYEEKRSRAKVMASVHAHGREFEAWLREREEK